MLEDLLSSLDIDLATNAILSLTLVIFIIGLFLNQRNSYTKFVNYVPSLLTTIGIFGTFFGIVLGLLNFDQNAIEGSIPPLLAGLKTAFITSLAGIFASIIFKTLLTFSFLRPKERKFTHNHITSVDFITVMQAQVDEIAKLRNDLSKALIGKNETSLSTLLNNLQAEIRDSAKKANEHANALAKQANDHAQAQAKQAQEQAQAQAKQAEEHAQAREKQADMHAKQADANAKQAEARSDALAKSLQQQFMNLTDCLSQMATKESIAQLEKIIADFNTSIATFNISLNEQFGEKFKYFHDALNKSIRWQQNYNIQFEQLQELYNKAIDSITTSEGAIQSITKQSEKIPATMDALKQVIIVNQHQISELERHMAAFHEMREKAISAVPFMTDQLNSAMDNLVATVDTINGHHQNMLLDSDKVFKAHVKTSNEFIDQFSEEINVSINHLRDTNVNLADDMERVSNNILNSSQLLEKRLLEVTERAAEQHLAHANLIFRSMEEQIEQQAGFTANAVNSQLKQIDESMHHEITHVISQMGEALSQISGQFVEDYNKLTAAMYRIVTQHRAYKQKLEQQNLEQ